jgi:hypothetical protein
VTNEKGTRRERQARELYAFAGYECQPFHEQRYAEGDGFGLFDFLAIHPHRKPRLVQVKSNSTQGDLGEVVSFAHERIAWPDHVEIDFAVCHDCEGWRLLQPVEDSGTPHTVAVDERDHNAPMGETLALALQDGEV